MKTNACQINNVYTSNNTHFVYCVQVKILSGKITTTIFRSITPKWKQTSDYDQIELWCLSGQKLSDAGLKLLVAIEAAHATTPRLFSEHLLQK